MQQLNQNNINKIDQINKKTFIKYYIDEYVKNMSNSIKESIMMNYNDDYLLKQKVSIYINKSNE